MNSGVISFLIPEGTFFAIALLLDHGKSLFSHSSELEPYGGQFKTGHNAAE